MKIVSSSDAELGGVTLLTHYCLFNDSDSITHFSNDTDSDLYELLPNLYAVCISDNSQENRKVTAGFVIKTTYTHNDSEFLNALINIVNQKSELKPYYNDKTSFLPAKLSATGKPLTEAEFLQVMQHQFLKFNVDGRS
ncbi:hypothetical protein [Acinetobacter sp. HR7]|uniref:hypothetical protein n=1 Tax=Acinetobacter sp. HR7 TaxID=1509403 RepID=UPI00053894F8|nr:hypothetical protein [Acinetobacter sp. HR7]KGT48118.1 hypothetical protein GW12_08330 [Acinetobacter sp. HR7]